MTAINFPPSPSNGDTHVVGDITYTYDSTETKWKTTVASNAFLPLSGGTIGGSLTVDDDLTVDTDTLFVDSSTNRVGIGSSTPGTTLAVAGGVSGTAGINISGGGWGVLPYVANSLVADSTSGQTRLFATGTDASTHGNLVLFTGTTNGTATERMRITSTGDLRFNSGYGSAATAYGCRAWANFNGSGTVAILASGNVSSIGDRGTGQYTLNFTNAMPDGDYTIFGTSTWVSATWGAVICPIAGTTSTSDFDFNSVQASNLAYIDAVSVMVGVIR
jgi:hypothetical protein